MKKSSLVSLSLATSAIILVASSAIATIFRPTQKIAAFSPDSRYYIHLESSRDTGPEIPKAQLQIVDVATNTCVEEGCIETEYGKDSSRLPVKAAEDDLLKQSLPLRQRLKLTAFKTGRRLPIVSRKNLDNGLDRIIVPLSKDENLQIFLQQRYQPSVVKGGTGDTDKASMRLVVFRNYSRLTVGSFNNYREGVLKYAIRDVYLSPNGKNVVVLLDMTKHTFNGVLQTTLVQGFTL